MVLETVAWKVSKILAGVCYRRFSCRQSMVICTLVSTPKHDEQWCRMLNVVMMLANVMRSSGGCASYRQCEAMIVICSYSHLYQVYCWPCFSNFLGRIIYRVAKLCFLTSKQASLMGVGRIRTVQYLNPMVTSVALDAVVSDQHIFEGTHVDVPPTLF